MIHVCQDDAERIGRPPVVRDRVLSCLRTLKRASVSRLEEETGAKTHTIQYVLRKAYQRGEIARERAKGGDYRTFFVYESKP